MGSLLTILRKLTKDSLKIFQILVVPVMLVWFHKNWASSDISSAFRKFSGNLIVAIQLLIDTKDIGQLEHRNKSSVLLDIV